MDSKNCRVNEAKIGFQPRVKHRNKPDSKMSSFVTYFEIILQNVCENSRKLFLSILWEQKKIFVQVVLVLAKKRLRDTWWRVLCSIC